MAFNTKEQEIIKWGLSNGKSKQEVEKAITNFRLGITTPKPENKELGYVDRLKESFGERKEEIKDIRDSEASLPEKILQEAGQVAGGAFDIVAEAPGIKQGLDLVGKGISKIPGVQQLGEKAGEAYSKIPERARKNIEAVGNIASLIPVGMGAKGSVVAGEKAVQAGSKAIPIVQEGLEQTFKAGKKILPKSEEIMNRVARLTPTQARKFETLAGKTHGQYLKETGNFGAPDEIVKKEAQKFTQSIKSVDDSLAQLPGKFQEGVVDDILEELEQKALATSTKNVNSPYLVRVKDLIHKNQTEGLTMSEINEAKRLYEKNVKLGYNKLLQGEQIQRATNLDNAVREWQVNKAEELGFTNLKELNKQTQLSKQLINSLGDQVIGKTGLNGVSLTDWIVLSGGDVSSVAGFLTKKFLSSKGVQARIAEWLNDVKVKPMIKPKITPSKPTTQPVLKTQSKSALPNTTTKSLKVKGETPTTNLVAEAKKYKSAEEFVKAQGDMQFVHNLSPEQIIKANELGGLPAPSIATVNPNKTDFTRFGEISLIPKKSVIDGQKTVLSDAYTQTFGNIDKLPDNISTKRGAEWIDDAMQKEWGAGAKTPSGFVRSQLVEEVDSIADIQKNISKLTSKSYGDKIKADIDYAIHSLAERINKNPNDLIEARKARNIINDAILGKTDGLSQDIISEINKLRQKIIKAPTEYFETKIGRNVGLDEFSHALVPKGISQDVIKVLKDKGVIVIEKTGKNDLSNLTKSQLTDIWNKANKK